ncbi:MAG: DUF5692 family protein, partial [Pseudomonadota bacterium]
MGLFEAISGQAWLAWFGLFLGLIALNELVRASKWAALVIFCLVPIVLTPYWLSNEHELRTWFIWSKTYSIIAFALLVLFIRFFDFHVKNKWFLFIPALLLVINILEAVLREWEYGTAVEVTELGGLTRIAGDWNLLNAVAGILCMLSISGWMAIQSNNPRRDMVWADQIPAWLIAYNLWHFAFIYNLAPDQAFYTGLAVNLAALVPALLWASGKWMQTRVFTLAFYMLCLV